MQTDQWGDRKRLAALGLAALLALTGTSSGQAQAQVVPGEREVRVFALAYRHELARHASYGIFSVILDQEFEAQIVPALREDAPNLIVYPEAVGLAASFTGRRGDLARFLLEEGRSLGDAFSALAVAYAPQIAYYQAKYADADAPGQLLRLALTDTTVRAIVETFSGLASRHRVYLSVSTDLPSYERVEGEQARFLGDPEEFTGYAYEATAPEVYNRNLIFGPDGALLGSTSKSHPEGVELNRGSLAGSGLAALEIDGIEVVDLPFARVGAVLGRDARMSDVTDRFEQLRAEILLHPSAHGAWAQPGFDIWPPDKFQRGGWWTVQKQPGVQAVVGSMLAGNLGDRLFDGQAHVAVAAPDGDVDLCLLGQPTDHGWAAVGPWRDLTEPVEATCGSERREHLWNAGRTLGPASETSVVFVDLTLPARMTPSARVAGARFAPSTALPGDASQVAPALDAGADGAWLAWVDLRRGPVQTIFAARSEDGATWTDPVAVDPWDVHAHSKVDNQWAPRIAVPPAGDTAEMSGLTAAPVAEPLVVFVGFPRESWDVGASRSTDAGTEWTVAFRIDDADRLFGVSYARQHSSAVAVAWPHDAFTAAWSDLRRPFTKPQIRVARSDGGDAWSASVRPDGGPVKVAEEENQLGPRNPGESRGQAFPALAKVGDEGLLVAWQELSEDGVPSIYLAASPDRGETFEPFTRLSDGQASAWRPALAASGDRAWLVWEQAAPDGSRRLVLRASTDEGASWGAPIVLDPSGPAGSVQRYATVVPLHGGAAAVVYEDDRAGDSDVLGLVVDANGTPSAPARLDDAPDGARARVPTATLLPDGRLLVAWQDTRGDVEQIRTAAGPPPVGAAALPATETVEEPPAPEPPAVEAAPAPLPTTGSPSSLATLAAILLLLAWATRRQPV